MKVTTTTGVELDDEAMMAPNLTAWAKRYGLPHHAFVATHPNGRQEYCLVNDGAVVYAKSAAEDVAAHLDMLSLVEKHAING